MSSKKPKTFRLTNAFSVVSLVGIIIVAVISTYVHQSVSLNSLLQVQNEANIDLTRAFSNSIWKKYVDFFERSSAISRAEIINQPEINALEADLKRQMKGIRVVKIKVYNRNGLTVFSTDRTQIGEDKSKNPGFISAFNGEVINEISFRDKFNAFDMVIEDRNLLASYIPIHYGPNDEVVAVFELYSDITTLLEEIDESEFQSVALGAFLMLLLYAFLLIYVRRADAIIKKHEAEERAIHEERVRYISEYDQLTGLLNRQAVEAQISRLVERSTSKIAFIYIDIHRFKLVNDMYGQEKSDELLLELVYRLSNTIGNPKLLGRAGPDEFIVATNFVSDRVLHSVLNRLVKSLTEPYNIDDSHVNISISVGVVKFPLDTKDSKTVIKSSEAAMLQAKKLGKNRYAFFAQQENERAEERFELENALSNALEAEEFELFYQPRVGIQGNPLGAEALIRWRRNDGQLISPALFIHALEETELIVPVGEWVLTTACRECMKWHKEGHTNISISVNLSLKQFTHGNIIETVRKALLNTGLVPSALELELTESLFAENPEEMLSYLKALKALGVSISLDDFGTGYSSLSYLRKFPIDYLKIDQAFVRDIDTNQVQFKLTKSIVDMAQALDMKTVAEGVEELSQLQSLQELGVDELQGYYFSKPVPAEDFRQYLASNT